MHDLEFIGAESAHGVKRRASADDRESGSATEMLGVHDLYKTNLTGCLYMGSAARAGINIADADDADLVRELYEVSGGSFTGK